MKKMLFRRNKNKFCFLLFIFISLLAPNVLFAHPHVFIDNTLTIVFDQNGLKGIKAKWDFDEMYSSTLIQDFDMNKDCEFNNTEIEKIKQEAFSNLKNFNYFTCIVIDEKNFDVKDIKDFSAWVDSGRVIYNFLIPCRASVTSSYKEIKISTFDATYFVDILLAGENPVRFEDTSHIDFTYRIFEDTTNAYYFGQIFPETIVLRFRGKK